MAILSILFTVIIIAVSVLMVLVVLIQRPKQEGLGAAFGGGTLDSALGAHTTDILQKFTTWLGVIFFICAIGLAIVKAQEFRGKVSTDILEGVENRESDLPPMPANLEGIPTSPELDVPAESSPTEETPAPEADVPAKPKADNASKGGKAKDAAPGAADNPKGKGKAENGGKAKAPADKGGDKG